MTTEPATNSASEPRFFVGALGLFYVSTMIMLAVWAMLPSLALGWNPVVITSGSMQPTIQPGDIIVAAQPQPSLGSGTVIVFDDPASGGLVTHRIWSARANGEYVTKGDANLQPDSTPITDQNVRGVGRVLVPLIGKPGLWLRSDLGKFLAWITITVGAFYTSRWAIYEKHNPWREPAPGVLGRHRKTTDYVGRHLKPRRFGWLGPMAKLSAIAVVVALTTTSAQSRAAWADQTASPQSTFISGDFDTTPAIVDVAVMASVADDLATAGDEATIMVAVTNHGDTTSTTTISSAILVEPLVVTSLPGETVTFGVVWTATTLGRLDIEFTATTDADTVPANDVTSVRIVVQA